MTPPLVASAILGIGIDLAECSRLARSIQQPRFVTRVFAAEEIDAFVGPPADVARLTEAFALKEALLKAIGTGWAEGVGFNEIVGPPLAEGGTLVLRGRAAEVARRLGVCNIRATVRATGELVVASVVLVGTPELEREGGCR
jgi:holo-[acyl-carrier protein] synthase